MKINGQEIIADKFAYDGCHKIYIIEDEEDLEMAKEYEYEIHDIKELEDIYIQSCELRFIDNWKLDKCFASQYERVVFED